MSAAADTFLVQASAASIEADSIAESSKKAPEVPAVEESVSPVKMEIDPPRLHSSGAVDENAMSVHTLLFWHVAHSFRGVRAVDGASNTAQVRSHTGYSQLLASAPRTNSSR